MQDHIYNEQWVEEMIENDEIDTAEQGFIMGYIQEV